jgi:hypothetical protein
MSSSQHFSDGSDRRKEHREPKGVDVRFTNRAGRPRIRGRSIDLSVHGLCLETERSFLPGEKISINFSIGPLSPMSTDARVCWTQDAGQGRHRIGLEFLSIGQADRARLEKSLEKHRSQS